MQRYKKPMRLLVEELGRTIEHGYDGSIRVCFDSCSVTFKPLSRQTMVCNVDLSGTEQSFEVSKDYVFDVIECLKSSSLASYFNECPNTTAQIPLKILQPLSRCLL